MGIGVSGATVTVQIDLSGTTFGGSPTWTDVSSWVLTKDQGSPISITWGRQDWLSDVAAATCEFVLDNRDGRFTPGLSSSVYYPNVKRRVRCRVSCVIAATTVYLFDGLIDSWQTSYTSQGLFSVTTVSATDILGRLGTENPLRPMGHEEILLDAPTSFWPLNDQGPTLGDVQNVGAELTAVPGFTGLGANYQNVTFPPNVSTGFVDPDMVGVGLQGYFSYISCSALAIPTTFEMHFSTINTSFGAAFITDTSGNAVVVKSNGYVSTSPTGPNVSSLPVNDGRVHQIALQGGHIWVDGVDTGTAHGLLNINTLGFDLIGTVFNVASFPTTLSQARMLDHYYGSGGWGITIRPSFYGERTDVHMGRLLSYRTNFGSVLDVGVGTVSVHSTAGVDLQQALYDTADAEGGVVFADGQSRIVFRNRSHMFSPATTLTLDASQGQVETTTVYRDDTQFLVNDVTISTPSGATQRYFDAASIANDGVVAQQISLIIDNDGHALAAAKWRVQVGTQEQISATQLDVNLFTVQSATTVKGVLQLQPLDVVALTGMPAPVPSTETFMVQGGSLSVGVDQFTASLFTTVVPAGDPY